MAWGGVNLEWVGRAGKPKATERAGYARVRSRRICRRVRAMGPSPVVAVEAVYAAGLHLARGLPKPRPHVVAADALSGLVRRSDRCRTRVGQVSGKVTDGEVPGVSLCQRPKPRRAGGAWVPRGAPRRRMPHRETPRSMTGATATPRRPARSGRCPIPPGGTPGSPRAPTGRGFHPARGRGPLLCSET